MSQATRTHRYRTHRTRWIAALLSMAFGATMLTRAGAQTPYWNSSSQPSAYPAVAVQPATFQDETDPNAARFRAYPLNHLDPSTAQQHLSQFFANTPNVEVVPDVPRNRVLVRGNPQVLVQAGELLAKLDPPSPLEHTPLPPSEPAQRLESYPLDLLPRDVVTLLQNQATNQPNVRVAVDERSAQALVLAPDATHDWVRNQIAQLQTPLAKPMQPAAATPPYPQQGGTRSGEPLRLRHLHADELRVRLERLLSRPLPASTDSSGQWQTFVIEAVPGAGVTATINPATGELHLTGPDERTRAWRTVIAALDSVPTGNGAVTELVATKPSSQNRVRQVLEVVQKQSGPPAGAAGLVATMLQPDPNSTATPAPPSSPQASTAQSAIDMAQAAGELLGPVQIEFVEGLDVIVLRGSERDVERVMQIIEQIERLSAVTVPTIEVYPLKSVDGQSLAALLSQLYQQVLGPRLGDVSITPLVKPNSLLLVGREENVRMAIELIQRLDVPVPPTSGFEIIPLKHAAAADAKAMIDQFLGQTETEDEATTVQAPSLAPTAMVVADVRTNSLIVSAGPRDMAEIKAIVARIDAPGGEAVDQVRVFPLRNAIASEMAEVLRSAIQTQAAPAPAEGDGGAGPAVGTGRASALEFRRIGAPDGMLKAGVLTGARISADVRANSIIVTAPADSMDLIAALIAQLDQAPNVAAELKVFTLENGDAVALVEMLRTLFGTGEEPQDAATGGLGGPGLVRMQFSVDERTNSIIAAGTREDLAVVEAILLRLDQGDVRERINVVYRLNNAYALNVSETLNAWLQTQRTAETEAQVAISPFEQIEREVIIVPEIATNSLVVSATPRYFKEIEKLIQELDERPPMVMIQVLIAEVRLNDTDEFGVELGLQDSLLFDRSLLSDVQFQDVTTTFENQTTQTQQTVISANGQPGFNFNSTQPLGNNLSTAALATASQVATQGLSNFAMGRGNSELGFGGFVFSASSSGVNVLLRALQEKRRVEVLSRPQIMALDGQTGYVLVGQRVPTISGVTLDTFGQTNNIIYQQVGIIMQVTPRISPDGLVVMQVQTEKSEVGPEADGIPISISAGGQVVRAPRIDATTAVTTVSALSGQTVVLSGLLTNRRRDVHRSVPLISDIPLIGDLFRYDLVAEERSELLIILTPRIVHNKLESDILKQVESSRMSWILSDVINLHGDVGLRSRCDEWADGECDAVYPTYIPGDGETIVPTESELLPTPVPGDEPQAIDGPALEPALARAPGATNR